MITAAEFRAFALSLPEVEEAPHFELVSFRIKKKIFATLNAPHGRATLRFTPETQDIFSHVSNGALFPVPNKWGHYGWTHLVLDATEHELLEDALRNAWWETAPDALRKKYADLLLIDEARSHE
ncbi:MAG: MmcQ/YjbR family DNA-binding protein [Saprospiraceae bacterium]|nr:MmcQ/YjbR family DNA-binding protein [Saprospiraceae bacterium]